MLNIAICDPNKAHRETLKEALGKLLFDAVEYTFYDFENSQALRNACLTAPCFQLAFFEIHLGDGNGLYLAEELKKSFTQIDVIFLTDAAEFIGDGYRCHAFDFLIKPVSFGRLQDTVSRYLEERKQRPVDFLNVCIKRSQIQIPLYQILYLESQKRKILIHLPDQTLEYYDKLDRLEEMLSGSGFIRCHQSYLCNLRCVQKISSTSLMMLDHTELPISRAHLNALRDALKK